MIKSKHKGNFVDMATYLTEMEQNKNMDKLEYYNSHCTNFRLYHADDINWDRLRRLKILSLDDDYYYFTRYGKNWDIFQEGLKDYNISDIYKLLKDFEEQKIIYKCLPEYYPEETIKDVSGMPLDLLYYTYSKKLEQIIKENCNDMVPEVNEYKAKLFQYAVFEYDKNKNENINKLL